MNILAYVGDGLWILALAIMSGASREAWKRVPPEVGVPLQFRPDGTPSLRAHRTLAFAFLPVTAFFISLILVVRNRNVAATPDEVLILFGVRAVMAALFPLAHLRWLKAAMEALEKEGSLKPRA